MHAEIRHCLATVRDVFPEFFSGVSVLEIGSADINGSVRSYFQSADYVGVDLIPGPGVDVVGQGEDVRLNREFDVAVSTECLEHNPKYFETFENMVRHVRPGGLVLFTCATTGRPEHGTERSDPGDSPGTMVKGWNYYRNVEPEDLGAFPFDGVFESFRFYVNRISCDLYFVGLKKPFDGAKAGRGLDRIATTLSVDESNRLTMQVSSMLKEIEQLNRNGGDPARIAVEIDKAQQKLKQTQDALIGARNQLHGVENSKTFRLVGLLPSLRKRIARARRIVDGI
ncbi:MAG: methyltransferase domain-containing protein [Xanthobacteraceae bacterium]|jgi:SAM-dependent methyltransferase|nr:methyltransferase domain-containing protein [Xanthobacteraceae bacterium]